MKYFFLRGWMMEGIILDMKVGDKVEIWFKRSEKSYEVIEYKFRPTIYLSKRDLDRIISFLPPNSVYEINNVRKLVHPGRFRKPLIEIVFRNYSFFIRFRRKIKGLYLNIYNNDIFIEQQFLQVPTLNLIDLQVKEKIDGKYLGGLDPDPPNLRVAVLSRIDDRTYELDLIEDILTISEEEELKEILTEFDVDVLVYDDDIKINEMELSRDGKGYGRLFIPKKYFSSLPALCEKALFTYVSPRRIAFLSTEESIDARQCYYAQKFDIVVPPRYQKRFIKSENFFYFETDKGDLIITPEPGLYENVLAIDLTSIYPIIIVDHDISYETCLISGIRSISRKAFISSVIKEPIERMITYSKIKESNNNAYERYGTLKQLLSGIGNYISLPGNRFRNSFCRVYVSYYAKEKIFAIINIVKELGFNVIYADTETLYIQRDDIKEDNMAQILHSIEERAKLPLDIIHYYDYLSILPLNNNHAKIFEENSISSGRDKIRLKGFIALENQKYEA